MFRRPPRTTSFLKTDRGQQDTRKLAAARPSWRNATKLVCACTHIKLDHHGEVIDGTVVAKCIHTGCSCTQFRLKT